jgi:hypothetical protein
MIAIENLKTFLFFSFKIDQHFKIASLFFSFESDKHAFFEMPTCSIFSVCQPELRMTISFIVAEQV